MTYDANRPWWQAPPAPGTPASEVRPGMMIGGYHVDAIAGRGGMGVVCRATQVALARTVALKVIAPQFAGDPVFRDRFRQECQLAASLDHPHIVPVFEAGDDSGLLFVSMRWIDGVDLRCLIDDEGALDPVRAVGVVAQVASALDAAHRAGLIHRDVKPANILIESRDGADHAYLGDFGLVKRVGVDPGLTGSLGWIGTVDYVAPEQVRGEEVGVPADIYALGAVAYTALSGSVPFPRPDMPAKLYACVNDPLPALAGTRPVLPAEIDDVLARATAKDPAERYRSAGELAVALQTAVAAPVRTLDAPTLADERGGSSTGPDGITAPEPAVSPASATWPAPAPLDQPRRHRRRRWATTAAAVAVIVVVGVVGSALALTGGHGTPPTGRRGAGLPPGGHRLATTESATPRSIDVVTHTLYKSPDRFRVTIYDLRRTGPYVTLDLGVVCLPATGASCSNDDFSLPPYKDLPDALHRGTYATIGGIRLIDPAHAKEYEVVRDAHDRAFSSQFSGGFDPGSMIYQAWAKYPAPPSSVTSMDLLFPWSGPAVTNVPVTTGPPPSPSAPVSVAPAGPFDRPPGSTDTRGLTLQVNDLVSTVGNPTAYASQAAQQTTVTLSADVLFDFNQATLTPAAQTVLAAQASRIKSGARGTVTVAGYTDSLGPDSVNVPLSLARAQAVVAALTPEVAGTSVNLKATGQGAADPVAPNTNPDNSDNPAGRALNRRVTVAYTVAGTPAPPPPPPAASPPSSGPSTVIWHDTMPGGTDDYRVTANSLTRSGQYLLASLTVGCTGSTVYNGFCKAGADFAPTSDTLPPLVAVGSASGVGDNTAGAVYLTDSAGAQYAAVRASTGALLTGNPPDFVGFGDTLHLWLCFPAPPASVTTETIDLPGGADQITGVPVAAGS